MLPHKKAKLVNKMLLTKHQTELENILVFYGRCKTCHITYYYIQSKFNMHSNL